jgi:hypothetical protein
MSGTPEPQHPGIFDDIVYLNGARLGPIFDGNGSQFFDALSLRGMMFTPQRWFNVFDGDTNPDGTARASDWLALVNVIAGARIYYASDLNNGGIPAGFPTPSSLGVTPETVILSASNVPPDAPPGALFGTVPADVVMIPEPPPNMVMLVALAALILLRGSQTADRQRLEPGAPISRAWACSCLLRLSKRAARCNISSKM